MAVISALHPTPSHRPRKSYTDHIAGINCPPPDASVVRQTEDSAKLFEKWANPRRPADNVITVETTGGLEMALDYILKQIISSARG
jgi:hypothetical protein